MSKEITLYHGCDSDTLSAINSGLDLIGWTDDRTPNISGNLTDSETTAIQCALFSGKGRPEATPILLKYELSKDMVRLLGKIAGYSSDGFATNFEIPPQEVPQVYLVRVGFTSDAIGVKFYRVPTEYLKDIIKLR